MDIVIVGCGRVGASLANLLADSGHGVTMVDRDPAAFVNLGDGFQGRTVVGQGFDEDILIDAGIDSCDAFAAVTSSDNVNLMASEVARRLHDVPHVLTRLIDPERLGVYEQLGLDYICDTELVAESISARIMSGKSHHLDTFGDYELMTFMVDAPQDTLRVRDLESLGDVEVLLVEHDEEVIKATPNIFLHTGDMVMVMAQSTTLDSLSHYMHI